MIDRNKVISKSRQREVEHSFETMVGCRKNRYCNTPEQKKRTEFFEDYYLLYIRKDEEIKILKKALELTNQHITFCPAKQGECGCLKDKSKKCSDYFLNKAKEMLKDE